MVEDEWRGLLRLVGELSRLPLGDVDDAAMRALRALCALLRAREGHVALLVRADVAVDRTARALGGWRAVYRVDLTPARADGDTGAIAQKGRAEEAPLLRAVLEGAGRRRVHLRREAVGDDDLVGSALADHFRQEGIGDRIVGVEPLGPDIEALVCLDRATGAPPFSSSDRALLGEALEGVCALLVRLARSAGQLDCSEPLTPRERDVLRLLLTGRREADIATALEMGRRSLHQRVVNIYRKFGVSSRPQLMALWLNVPAEVPPED